MASNVKAAVGLGALASVIGANLAKSAVSAVKNSSTSGSGSASSGSSSSSGSTSSGGWGGTTSYNYTDSDGNQRTSGSNTDYAAAYEQAKATGNLAGMQAALEQRAQKLGSNKDSWQLEQESYLNSYKNAQQQQWNAPATQYQSQVNDYMDEYAKQQEAMRAEQEAKVQQNIAALNAQKPGVQQAGAQANRAAQQQYMSVLDPNGANAEQLAALGLSSSGLSEDAAIRANNAYLSAVNENEQNVNNQLAAIDLAIENARLSGDIATAQQLQSYYDTVLNAGLQAAGNIASLNQWGLSNAQNQTLNGVSNGYTQAGLTGWLGGQPTMAGQQLSYTIEGMSLDNQIKAYQLLLQQAYGMKQTEAEYQAQLAANSGANLANEYQKLLNELYRKKYGL